MPFFLFNYWSWGIGLGSECLDDVSLPLVSLFGEGNGTPLQYSCLENPMDGGAWWAAVHGVATSRTWLSDFTFFFSLSCIGEGNGNPLQCSCLENPRDRGAWWTAVYGVAQSRTWLKRLSSSNSSIQIKNRDFEGGGQGLSPKKIRYCWDGFSWCREQHVLRSRGMRRHWWSNS